MKPLQLIFLLFTFSLLAGCGNDATVYHRYHAVSSSQGWKQTDTLAFLIPDTLSGHQYELEIGLRHTEMYPYRDIWMALLHPLDSLAPDTFHLELASPEGEWLGKGNAGNTYQYSTYAGKLTLLPADTLFQLVQIMKDSCLRGITDAGIRLSLTGGIDAQKDK